MTNFDTQEIRYAAAGDGSHVAYRVQGAGSIVVLEIGGFGTVFPFDAADEQPLWRRFEERLARFCRLIRFDHRGMGNSDPLPGGPTMETWVADAMAVVRAVGADRVALLASAHGVPTAIQLAAEHPDSVDRLILANGLARMLWADDYEIGFSTEVHDDRASIADLDSAHDDESSDIDFMAPSLAAEQSARRWWSRSSRRGASPAFARAHWEHLMTIDVRHLVPCVSQPVLVMYSNDNRFVPPGASHWLGEHLPNSRSFEIAGADHLIWAVPGDGVASEIEEFLTGTRSARSGAHSMLAVLFTDIVDSTMHNTNAGDTQWVDLLARHDALAKSQILRRDGRVVKGMGDGLLAVFALCSDAVNAGVDITSAAESLGVTVRAAVHVAEVEEVDGDILGLGVTIAARALGHADGSEVVTTEAVAQVLAGSAFEFDYREPVSFKGVTGTWRLAQTRRATP